MKNITSISLVIILTSFSFPLISPDISDAVQFSLIRVEEIVGSSAPDFTLKNLDGNKVDFSTFRGKTILLNFWATWCPYCRQERASLNKIYNKYKDQGFEVIAVSVDRSLRKVKKFIESYPADFIILSDTGREAAAPYSVVGLPTSFLIDSKGIVRHKYVGMKEWTSDVSIKQIEALMK